MTTAAASTTHPVLVPGSRAYWIGSWVLKNVFPAFLLWLMGHALVTGDRQAVDAFFWLLLGTPVVYLLGTRLRAASYHGVPWTARARTPLWLSVVIAVASTAMMLALPVLWSAAAQEHEVVQAVAVTVVLIMLVLTGLWSAWQGWSAHRTWVRAFVPASIYLLGALGQWLVEPGLFHGPNWWVAFLLMGFYPTVVLLALSVAWPRRAQGAGEPQPVYHLWAQIDADDYDADRDVTTRTERLRRA